MGAPQDCMAIDEYLVVYHPLVVKKDIPRLDKKWREIIRLSIEQKLVVRPELFGAPLRQTLQGNRKLRVGDYRVVYNVHKKSVGIIVICHRSVVYDEGEKRF